MTLPTLTLPKYRMKVSTIGEMVSYRPFIVKEEKVLLIALEGGTYSMISNAIKHIVDECTFNKLDIENLPVFDLTHIFINIRAKSVGETVEPLLSCINCGHNNAVEVDLTKLKIKNDKKHTNKISLGDDMGIVMKYPVVQEDIDNEELDTAATNVVASCIDLVYKGDDVYKSSECESQELIDFIDRLTHKQFEKIIEFFDTMPKLSTNIKFKCEKCGENNTNKLEGLVDFFL